MASTKTSGTKEWAKRNVNCVNGCVNNCGYCYAAQMAVRFKRKTRDTWKNMTIRRSAVLKRYHKVDGTIMFPTSHDLVPGEQGNNTFGACMWVLGKMLRAGNDVLIVTKPRLEAVRYMCEHFSHYKQQIVFRFTITSMNDDVLKEWEPGAPSFVERVAALEHAFDAGFKTSISCEPALCSVDDIATMIGLLQYNITDSFWIGTMNHKRGPVQLDPREIYERFHDNPLVRFKDSITNALQLMPTITE